VKGAAGAAIRIISITIDAFLAMEVGVDPSFLQLLRPAKDEERELKASSEWTGCFLGH
jgi:hypothetical protein